MIENTSLEEELRFCQVIYFPSVKLQNWMELFSKFALKYATDLGRILTHFNLWPKENTTKSSILQYIKRNQVHLTEAFSSEKYKGISFYSRDKGAVWSSLYISLLTEDILSLRDLGMGRGDELIYGTLIIEYKLDFLKKYIAEANFAKKFLNDANSIIKAEYGAVTVMQWKKIPDNFFRNSTSYYLTPEEHQEVEIWRKEGHRFQTILRDIYWGNVITRSHWGNDKAKEQYLLKALENECRGNVFWIDENTLFFCAPFAICPQDDPKILDFKKRLYRVFDDCEIEVIGAHLDNYPEPQSEPIISNLLQENTNKKANILRSKKKLIIRYHIKKGSQETIEHECISDILKQAGPLPLVIKSEKARDGLLGEIEVSGSKVLKVRKAIIHCIKKMNMAFEVNPPIDDEDSFEDKDFTVLQ